MRVGRLDPGAVKLRGRERQLIPLARRALLPRALHVEPIAFAPRAGQCAIDIDVDADVGAFRREIVRRHHVVDQRFDERGLIEIEECIAGGCRWRRQAAPALRRRSWVQLPQRRPRPRLSGNRGGRIRPSCAPPLSRLLPGWQSVRLSVLPGKTDWKHSSQSRRAWFGACRSIPRARAGQGASTSGRSKHDRHGFHPLSARPVQTRRVRDLRETLARHHPEQRRRSRRLLDAARGHQQHRVRADLVSEPRGL